MTNFRIGEKKKKCMPITDESDMGWGSELNSQVSNNSRENCPNLTFQESLKTMLSLLILKVPLAYIGLSTKKRDKIRYIPWYIIFTFY